MARWRVEAAADLALEFWAQTFHPLTWSALHSLTHRLPSPDILRRLQTLAMLSFDAFALLVSRAPWRALLSRQTPMMRNYNR
jgi:hypothetical protein